MEKETEKERGDEDTEKETKKERGDPGTRRKKRTPLCFSHLDQSKSPLCPQTMPPMGSILSLIFFR